MSAIQNFVPVLQGEFRISNDPRDMLSTVLGSCVAVCLIDTSAGLGGMNHFLLPGRPGEADRDVRYGVNAMELLINGLLRRGADRDRLTAKIFGGSRMAGHFRDIGRSNAEFTKSFLANEGIPCLAESLGGTAARRVRFWPTTGKVQVLFVPASAAAEPDTAAVRPRRDGADVTLF